MHMLNYTLKSHTFGCTFLDAQASQDEMIVTDWRTIIPNPNLSDIKDIENNNNNNNEQQQQQQQHKQTNNNNNNNSNNNSNNNNNNNNNNSNNRD